MNNRSEEYDLDELLKETRLGSDEAKNELFVRVQRYLAFIADQHYQSQLKAKAGASDIVQQTMMKAADEFDQFRGETSCQFRSWLRQILLNEVKLIQRHYNANRRNKAKEKPLVRSDSQGGNAREPLADSPSPSGVAMAAEDVARLRDALNRISPEMRQVIHLKNWERLSFHAIAERMGLSLSQAAKLWYQALEELKRLNSIAENE